MQHKPDNLRSVPEPRKESNHFIKLSHDLTSVSPQGSSTLPTLDCGCTFLFLFDLGSIQGSPSPRTAAGCMQCSHWGHKMQAVTVHAQKSVLGSGVRRRPQGVSEPAWTGILGSPACSPTVTGSVQLSYRCLPSITCLVLGTLLFNSNLRTKLNSPGLWRHLSPSAGRTQHKGSHGSANCSPLSGYRGPKLSTEKLPSWQHSKGQR